MTETPQSRRSAIAPQRAAGVRAKTLSWRPAISWRARLVKSVSIQPGSTRIGLDVVGSPGHRAGSGELHDAALAGGIGRREAGAKIDIIEPMLMILPPPTAFMAGIYRPASTGRRW